MNFPLNPASRLQRNSGAGYRGAALLPVATLLLSLRQPLGVVAIILPHLYGAPQPAEYKSLAPEGLAHQFIVAAVVTSLLFWLALGSLTGALYKRFAAA